MPSFRENRWQLDMQAFQTIAQARDVDILLRFAGNDPHQQNIQMKEMVNIGIDALIVAPTDVFSAGDGVAYAKKRGVPVLSYDRLAENCDVDAYVAFEREGVGDLMGRYLVKMAPRGNYILLRGPSADSNARDFYEGAMTHIRPLVESGDITVLMDEEVPGWRADAAEQLVDQALARTGDVVAVLAPNDDTAGGVVRALERKGLAGKVPVTGQDATPEGLLRIIQGVQGMTVLKDTNFLAREAVAVALAVAAGDAPVADTVTNNGARDVPTFVLPVTLVNKQSLAFVLRLPEFE